MISIKRSVYHTARFVGPIFLRKELDWVKWYQPSAPYTVLRALSGQYFLRKELDWVNWYQSNAPYNILRNLSGQYFLRKELDWRNDNHQTLRISHCALCRANIFCVKNIYSQLRSSFARDRRTNTAVTQLHITSNPMIYDQVSRGLTVVGWKLIYIMCLENCVQLGPENKPSLDFQGDFHTCPSPEIVPNNNLHRNSGALGCDAASTDKWFPAFSKDWHLKPLKMKASRYVETSDTTKRCCVRTQETEILHHIAVKNSPLPPLKHLAPYTIFLQRR